LQLRRATPSDAEAIASLHADSWRRHYRGAYSGAFLDGDVVSDRLVVLADRLREPDRLRYTLVVEDDASVIGFAHTLFDEDLSWGALLDNLHVDHGHKRCGIGSQLLASTASPSTLGELACTCGFRSRTSLLSASTRQAAEHAWAEPSSRLQEALRTGSMACPTSCATRGNPQQLTQLGAEHRGD